MADLSHHNNLLYSLSSNSPRLPPFSLPLSLSPHSNFSSVRFIALRRTRLSYFSVLANLSTDSTKFDIISTAEHSDGSVVFKFGDASEIRESVENVDSSDDVLNDTKAEFLGTSGGVIDDNDIKSEVVSTSYGEHDASDDKSAVVKNLEAEVDASDAKLKILETSNGDYDVNGEKTDVTGTANNELDANDAKLEVLDTLDGEHDHSIADLELVGTSDGEPEVQLERESVRDAEIRKIDENDSTELEHLVNGKPEYGEIAIESIAQRTESVVSSGVADETCADSLADLQSSTQPDGDSVEDEQNHNSVLTSETENSNDTEMVNHDVGGSIDSETMKGNVEFDTLVTTSESSVDLTVENSEEINDSEPVASLLTYQLEFDDEKSSHVEASNIAVSLEYSELESNMTHMVNEDVDSSELLEIAGTSSHVEASDVVVPQEDSEHNHNVKHVVNEDGELPEIAESSLHVEESDIVVSLEDSELDCNVKHLVNEGGDSIEQMQQSAQLEAEPSLDEEANSAVNVVASESASAVNMADGDPYSGGISEEAGPGALGITSAETNLSRTLVNSLSRVRVPLGANPRSVAFCGNETLWVDDSVFLPWGENSVEISTPALSMSSAAASLPQPLEALTGGEDAYFVCQNWFGVADGVGQWSLGGTNEGKYAQEFVKNCKKLALNSQSAGLTNIKEVLQHSAAMTQSSGSARVIIAHFDNQVLHVANIGDSGFVLIRNGAVFKKSSPMVHEFHFPYAISSGDDPLETAEEYHIELEEGDVIITATDGLFDNLYEQEIASMVAKSMGAGMKAKDVAELLAAKAQEVGRSASARTPFADAAQAAGHTGCSGGKLDHVTVIVSFVQSR